MDRDGFYPLELVARKQRTGKVSKHEYFYFIDVLEHTAYDILVEVNLTNVKINGAELNNIIHALEGGKDVITVINSPPTLKFRKFISLAGKPLHVQV